VARVNTLFLLRQAYRRSGGQSSIAEAAEFFNETQPRISNLLKGFRTATKKGPYITWTKTTPRMPADSPHP
jgi:hypothetical protein